MKLQIDEGQLLAAIEAALVRVLDRRLPERNGDDRDRNQPLLVGQREAARLLSVSERTIGNLETRGELHPTRLGRSKRFSLDELRRLASQQPATSAEEMSGNPGE